MPRETQNKILRVLVEQQFERVGGSKRVKVDVRIISSSAYNLEGMIAEGRFREDLFHRLAVVPVKVPALAERREDIPFLVDMFMRQVSEQAGIRQRKIGEDAMAVLQANDWPGNIRQLKNAVYRALTQLEGYELRPQDILLPDYDAGTVSVGEEAMEGSLDDITSRFERSVLTQLYRSYPSTRKLAKRLGVSHTAIANKLREYGLSQKKGDE